jgi:hypothetical protein
MTPLLLRSPCPAKTALLLLRVIDGFPVDSAISSTVRKQSKVKPCSEYVPVPCNVSTSALDKFDRMLVCF